MNTGGLLLRAIIAITTTDPFFSHGEGTTVSPLSLDGSWATPDAMRCKSYGSRFRHHFLSIRPLGKDRPPFLPFGLYT